MTRAVEALGLEPAWVLVDGNACPRWQRPSKAIVAGDAKCRSIAAASIVAKVTRDRMMAERAREYPGYGWETESRLPTPEHIRALDGARGDAAAPPQLRPGPRDASLGAASRRPVRSESARGESFESHHHRLSPSTGSQTQHLVFVQPVRTRSVHTSLTASLTLVRLTATPP